MIIAISMTFAFAIGSMAGRIFEFYCKDGTHTLRGEIEFQYRYAESLLEQIHSLKNSTSNADSFPAQPGRESVSGNSRTFDSGWHVGCDCR